MRAAIYARFSSELQDQRSITDQVALARKYVETRGLTFTQTYSDAAISGASTLNRPGLQSLLADALVGRFNVIVTESLDRLSRSQADIATLYEKMTFLGVHIETLADGRINEMHVGLKGTMSAMFLKDLAQKTRRGQVGRVKAGRIPGGKSYGYDVVRRGEERGLRTIKAYEAEIVRRIFKEYADGKGSMAIVVDLNKEGVAGPRGGKWSASCMLGSPKRLNGLLNNELYKGTIVYNRQRFMKDPTTGTRVARENPQSEWQRQEVPELRIIDQPLWDACRRGASESGRRISIISGGRNGCCPACSSAPAAAAVTASCAMTCCVVRRRPNRAVRQYAHRSYRRNRGADSDRAAKPPAGAGRGGGGRRDLSRGAQEADANASQAAERTDARPGRGEAQDRRSAGNHHGRRRRRQVVGRKLVELETEQERLEASGQRARRLWQCIPPHRSVIARRLRRSTKL